MRTTLSRRLFSRTVTAGLLGPRLLDPGRAAPAAEDLSPEALHALLAWLGYPPRDPAEAARLGPLARQTFELLQAIRKFEIPFELEPGVVFRPVGAPDATGGGG
jgi:hypothetical protein